MADCVEVPLWPLHPRTIYPVTSCALTFEVKAERSLTIILSTDLEYTSKCWIALAFNNNQRNMIVDGGHPLTFETENVLNGDEFRKIWLTWFDSHIRVGRDTELRPFMEAKCSLTEINYVSFVRLEASSNIVLKLDLAPLPPLEKPMYFEDGKPEWRTGVEQLPLGAVIGGIDKEPLYVIRAHHNGSLTPGKFVPSEGVGYIPWGGNANEKRDFEVLCGYNFKWIKSSNDTIPLGAMPAGHTEHTNEPLYVGRAEHEGSLIPGKVQPSHKVCYIPYDGKEVAKSHYEILVHVENPHRLRYALALEESPGQYIYEEDI